MEKHNIYLNIIEDIKNSDVLIDKYLNNNIEDLNIYKLFKKILSNIDPYKHYLINIMKDINDIEDKKARLVIYKVGLYYIFKLLNLNDDMLNNKINTYLKNPGSIDDILYYNIKGGVGKTENHTKAIEVIGKIRSKIESVSRLTHTLKTMLSTLNELYKGNIKGSESLVNVKVKLEQFFKMKIATPQEKIIQEDLAKDIVDQLNQILKLLAPNVEGLTHVVNAMDVLQLDNENSMEILNTIMKKIAPINNAYNNMDPTSPLISPTDDTYIDGGYGGYDSLKNYDNKNKKLLESKLTSAIQFLIINAHELDNLLTSLNLNIQVLKDNICIKENELNLLHTEQTQIIKNMQNLNYNNAELFHYNNKILKDTEDLNNDKKELKDKETEKLKILEKYTTINKFILNKILKIMGKFDIYNTYDTKSYNNFITFNNNGGSLVGGAENETLNGILYDYLCSTIDDIAFYIPNYGEEETYFLTIHDMKPTTRTDIQGKLKEYMIELENINIPNPANIDKIKTTEIKKIVEILLTILPIVNNIVTQLNECKIFYQAVEKLEEFSDNLAYILKYMNFITDVKDTTIDVELNLVLNYCVDTELLRFFIMSKHPSKLPNNAIIKIYKLVIVLIDKLNNNILYLRRELVHLYKICVVILRITKSKNIENYMTKIRELLADTGLMSELKKSTNILDQINLKCTSKLKNAQYDDLANIKNVLLKELYEEILKVNPLLKKIKNVIYDTEMYSYIGNMTFVYPLKNRFITNIGKISDIMDVMINALSKYNINFTLLHKHTKLLNVVCVNLILLQKDWYVIYKNYNEIILFISPYDYDDTTNLNYKHILSRINSTLTTSKAYYENLEETLETSHYGNDTDYVSEMINQNLTDIGIDLIHKTDIDDADDADVDAIAIVPIDEVEIDLSDDKHGDESDEEYGKESGIDEYDTVTEYVYGDKDKIKQQEQEQEQEQEQKSKKEHKLKQSKSKSKVTKYDFNTCNYNSKQTDVTFTNCKKLFAQLENVEFSSNTEINQSGGAINCNFTNEHEETNALCAIRLNTIYYIYYNIGLYITEDLLKTNNTDTFHDTAKLQQIFLEISIFLHMVVGVTNPDDDNNIFTELKTHCSNSTILLNIIRNLMEYSNILRIYKMHRYLFKDFLEQQSTYPLTVKVRTALIEILDLINITTLIFDIDSYLTQKIKKFNAITDIIDDIKQTIEVFGEGAVIVDLIETYNSHIHLGISYNVSSFLPYDIIGEAKTTLKKDKYINRPSSVDMTPLVEDIVVSTHNFTIDTVDIKTLKDAVLLLQKSFTTISSIIIDIDQNPMSGGAPPDDVYKDTILAATVSDFKNKLLLYYEEITNFLLDTIKLQNFYYTHFAHLSVQFLLQVEKLNDSAPAEKIFNNNINIDDMHISLVKSDDMIDENTATAFIDQLIKAANTNNDKVTTKIDEIMTLLDLVKLSPVEKAKITSSIAELKTMMADILVSHNIEDKLYINNSFISKKENLIEKATENISHITTNINTINMFIKSILYFTSYFHHLHASLVLGVNSLIVSTKRALIIGTYIELKEILKNLYNIFPFVIKEYNEMKDNFTKIIDQYNTQDNIIDKYTTYIDLYKLNSVTIKKDLTEIEELYTKLSTAFDNATFRQTLRDKLSQFKNVLSTTDLLDLFPNLIISAKCYETIKSYLTAYEKNLSSVKTWFLNDLTSVLSEENINLLMTKKHDYYKEYINIHLNNNILQNVTFTKLITDIRYPALKYKFNINNRNFNNFIKTNLTSSIYKLIESYIVDNTTPTSSNNFDDIFPDHDVQEDTIVDAITLDTVTTYSEINGATAIKLTQDNNSNINSLVNKITVFNKTKNTAEHLYKGSIEGIMSGGSPKLSIKVTNLKDEILKAYKFNSVHNKFSINKLIEMLRYIFVLREKSTNKLKILSDNPDLYYLKNEPLLNLIDGDSSNKFNKKIISTVLCKSLDRYKLSVISYLNNLSDDSFKQIITFCKNYVQLYNTSQQDIDKIKVESLIENLNKTLSSSDIEHNNLELFLKINMEKYAKLNGNKDIRARFDKDRQELFDSLEFMNTVFITLITQISEVQDLSNGRAFIRKYFNDIYDTVSKSIQQEFTDRTISKTYYSVKQYRAASIALDKITMLSLNTIKIYIKFRPEGNDKLEFVLTDKCIYGAGAVYGRFEYVYDINSTAKQLYNGLENKATEITRNSIQDIGNKDFTCVKVETLGASGSGKTAVLLGNSKFAEDDKKGILQQLLVGLIEKDLENNNDITFTLFIGEICGEKLDIDLNKIDIDESIILWKIKLDTMKTKSANDYVTYKNVNAGVHGDYLKYLNINKPLDLKIYNKEFKILNKKDNTETTFYDIFNDNNNEYAYVYQVSKAQDKDAMCLQIISVINANIERIQLLRRRDARVNCTLFNVDSSRSHMFFIIKKNNTIDTKFYVFMDKAGYEDNFKIAFNEIKLVLTTNYKNLVDDIYYAEGIKSKIYSALLSGQIDDIKDIIEEDKVLIYKLIKDKLFDKIYGSFPNICNSKKVLDCIYSINNIAKYVFNTNSIFTKRNQCSDFIDKILCRGKVYNKCYYKEITDPVESDIITATNLIFYELKDFRNKKGSDFFDAYNNYMCKHKITFDFYNSDNCINYVLIYNLYKSFIKVIDILKIMGNGTLGKIGNGLVYRDVVKNLEAAEAADEAAAKAADEAAAKVAAKVAAATKAAAEKAAAAMSSAEKIAAKKAKEKAISFSASMTDASDKALIVKYAIKLINHYISILDYFSLIINNNANIKSRKDIFVNITKILRFLSEVIKCLSDASFKFTYILDSVTVLICYFIIPIIDMNFKFTSCDIKDMYIFKLDKTYSLNAGSFLNGTLATVDLHETAKSKYSAQDVLYSALSVPKTLNEEFLQKFDTYFRKFANEIKYKVETFYALFYSLNLGLGLFTPPNSKSIYDTCEDTQFINRITDKNILKNDKILLSFKNLYNSIYIEENDALLYHTNGDREYPSEQLSSAVSDIRYIINTNIFNEYEYKPFTPKTSNITSALSFSLSTRNSRLQAMNKIIKENILKTYLQGFYINQSNNIIANFDNVLTDSASNPNPKCDEILNTFINNQGIMTNNKIILLINNFKSHNTKFCVSDYNYNTILLKLFMTFYHLSFKKLFTNQVPPLKFDQSSNIDPMLIDISKKIAKYEIINSSYCRGLIITASSSKAKITEIVSTFEYGNKIIANTGIQCGASSSDEFKSLSNELVNHLNNIMKADGDNYLLKFTDANFNKTLDNFDQLYQKNLNKLSEFSDIYINTIHKLISFLSIDNILKNIKMCKDILLVRIKSKLDDMIKVWPEFIKWNDLFSQKILDVIKTTEINQANIDLAYNDPSIRVIIHKIDVIIAEYINAFDTYYKQSKTEILEVLNTLYPGSDQYRNNLYHSIVNILDIFKIINEIVINVDVMLKKKSIGGIPPDIKSISIANNYLSIVIRKTYKTNKQTYISHDDISGITEFYYLLVDVVSLITKYKATEDNIINDMADLKYLVDTYKNYYNDILYIIKNISDKIILLRNLKKSINAIDTVDNLSAENLKIVKSRLTSIITGCINKLIHYKDNLNSILLTTDAEKFRLLGQALLKDKFIVPTTVLNPLTNSLKQIMNEIKDNKTGQVSVGGYDNYIPKFNLVKEI